MSLRKTLIELVIASSPLVPLAGCFPEDDPCTEYRERTLLVPDPPSAQLAPYVQACDADAARCIELCQQLMPEYSIERCEVDRIASGHEAKIGYLEYTGADGCGVPGRRPPGLRRSTPRRSTRAGAYLARAAWYEGASVYAFVGLARELRRHRAPAALTRASLCAARDEVAHAHLLASAAIDRGATMPEVRVASPRRRSIESIAIENAREGLVGETWSALVALYQAHHAPPALRATYAKIADDEIRHAELAIAIDAWAASRLSVAARRRVDAARRRAITKLARDTRTGAHRDLARELGLPSTPAMQRLFSDARSRLFV